MTVLVTIPTQDYSKEEATRIFNDIVGRFGGTDKTTTSLFEDELLGAAGRVNTANEGEFELPQPLDHDRYDTIREEVVGDYPNVIIQIEAVDHEPVHAEVDITA